MNYSLFSRWVITKTPFVFLFIFLANFPSVVSAATTSWSAGSGNWNVAGNWSSNAIPANGDDVVIDNGGTVLAPAGVTGGGNTVTVGNSATGTLTISGGNIGTYAFASTLIAFSASGNGTVNVSSGSLSQYFMDVGERGTGNLNISGGSVSATGYTYMGHELGSHGVAMVSGGIFNTPYLLIGFLGNGQLTVDGGTVTSDDVAIGTAGGGGGTASVLSGNWNVSNSFVVGNSGQGSLSISGGMVSVAKIQEGVGTGTINLNGGTLRALANQSDFIAGFEPGDVTLNSGGAFIDTNGFAVGITTQLSGSGSLTKQGSGTLALTGNNTYTGGTTVNSGTLSIAAGGAVNSSGTEPTVGVVVGQSASDNGTLLVTGTGSQLNITGSIGVDYYPTAKVIVGDSGTGALTISSGGAVHLTTASLIVGNSEGAIGAISVSGSNSSLTTDTNTAVGVDGSGSLTINGGGSAAFAGLQIGTGGGSGLGSGTVTVGGSGAGSLTNAGSSLGVINGALNVGAGGFVQSGTDTQLYVGHGGTLAISSGGDVEGFYASVDGTATVTGNGSKLELSSTDSGLGLNVGSGSGNGSLSISNHGLVDAGSRVQVLSGSNLAVSTNGTLTIGEQLYVSGNATISSGGEVNVAQDALIQSSGSVAVSGTSSLFTAQNLKVGGYNGYTAETASLEISNGAHVNTSSYSSIGAGSGNGSVSVTGSNSLWTTNVLIIGESGPGTLDVSNGGAVSAGTLNIHDSPVTVSGGGTLTAGNGQLLGGSITVTGSNSTWTQTSYVDVGTNFNPYPGTSVITVQDHAAVQLRGPQTRIYDQYTLRVEGDGTGTFEVGDIANNGVFEFAKSGSNTIASVISGTGSVVKSGTGTLTLSGSNTYTGNTTISGGLILFTGDNSAATGDVVVESGGALGGSGIIGGNVSVSGTLSPGNSPGLLTVNGDLTIASMGRIVMEFNGTAPGQFDQLFVGGTFAAGGTLQLTVNYAAQEGDAFKILASGGYDFGSFLISSNLGGGLYWNTSELASNGTISVVPEPSTYALLAPGLAALLFVVRRRKQTN